MRRASSGLGVLACVAAAIALALGTVVVAVPTAFAQGLAITSATWMSLQAGEGQFTIEWTPWNGTGVVLNDLYIGTSSATDSDGEINPDQDIVPFDPTTGSYQSYYTASPTGAWYFQLVIEATSCGSGGSVGICLSNVATVSTSGKTTTTTPATTTTSTPSSCGVPTTPYQPTGVFVTVTFINRTGGSVVVYDDYPGPLGVSRRSSLFNGEAFGYDDQTGGYFFVTSESTGKCLGHWQVTANETVTLTRTTTSVTTAPPNPCLTTATCVVPLLRAPTVAHGSATLIDAQGRSTPLVDAESLAPDDSVHTDTGVARLTVQAGALAAGSSVALVLGAGTVWALPALPLFLISSTVFQFTSLQALGDVLYDVNEHSVHPEVRTSEMITRVNFAACAKCAPMGPIPHLTSPSASFSVEVTNTYSRISVYAGAVSVQNLNGTKTTVNLEAGFQSVVRLSGPPTKPTRFTIPLHPFWQ